jgi:hypothetical protein
MECTKIGEHYDRRGTSYAVTSILRRIISLFPTGHLVSDRVLFTAGKDVNAWEMRGPNSGVRYIKLLGIIKHVADTPRPDNRKLSSCALGAGTCLVG